MKEVSDMFLTTAFGKISFDISNGEFKLKCLSDAEEKVVFASGTAPLWQLTFIDREKQLSSAVSAEPDEIETVSGKMSIFWTVANGSKVVVNVKDTGKFLAMDIAVNDVPADLALLEIAFPSFDWRPDRDESSALIVPSINGLRYTDPLSTVPDGGIYLEKKIRDRGFPHGHQNMQFLALEKQEMLCYFAAQDNEFGCKHFNHMLDQENSTIQIRPRWEVTPLYGQSYQSYDWVFKIVKGDWFDAAMIHRDYVLGQEFLINAGPLEETDRVPRWLLETPFVSLRHDRGAGYEVEHYIEAAKKLDTPMLIRYYMWMQSAFDTEYPFFFPTVPGFREDVKKCHEAGVRIIPYLNFYSAAVKGKHFSEIAHAAAEIDTTGKNHVAVWSQMTPLCAMCPVDPTYSHMIKDQLLRMLELGADGLYLDEFGMSPTHVCYSDKHGHVPGDPKTKNEGFSAIVRDVKAEAKDFAPEAVVSIEGYAENFIPDVDVFISGQIDPNFMIPLFQAVYHDYALGGFGKTTYPPDVNDPAFAGAFMTKQALQFIYGCQFGVARAPLGQILDSDPEAVQLLKSMCKAWTHSNNYLACGKMLRPLDLNVPDVELRWSMDWRDHLGTVIKLPQILNSVWQVNDGSVGVVLLNIKNEACPVHVDLNGVYMGDPIPEVYGGKANYHYPIPAMTAATLREYNGSDIVEKMASGNTHVGFDVTVPPLGCSILIISSEKDYGVHRREFSLDHHGLMNVL